MEISHTPLRRWHPVVVIMTSTVVDKLVGIVNNSSRNDNIVYCDGTPVTSWWWMHAGARQEHNWGTMTVGDNAGTDYGGTSGR